MRNTYAENFKAEQRSLKKLALARELELEQAKEPPGPEPLALFVLSTEVA